MRRREFIAGLGSTAAWPFAARAQQGDRVRRIGVLISGDEPQAQARVAALAEGLEKLGWIDGRNISIDYRWAVDTDRLRAYATELVGMGPDVLLAGGAAPLVALQKATQTIPIVFAFRQQFRRERCSARWQRHRLCNIRANHQREMARIA